MSADELWWFLPRGYLWTVAIEAPILLIGLSRTHPMADRLIAAMWLTACTYPIVVLVLGPLLMPQWPRGAYLAVAESFAPLAECVLFRLAFGTGPEARRDYLAIVAANLASFLAGEALNQAGWL